jgi:energy-converting hydrogenase B subunit D
MILEAVVLALMAMSIIAIEMRDLLYAVIVLGAADLLAALAFYLMAAPDIALTQAAVTTGMTVFIFLIVIGKTRRLEHGD